MRGSSPRQKKQKGSSGFSARPPASPEPPEGAGGSYTRSVSQSVQRVNPCRYSALHCGQNMVKRESTTPRNISTPVNVKHCASTQCALALYFLLFAKLFETGRKLLY